MAALPQTCSKSPPTAVAPPSNGHHLVPLAEVPTPGPSPSPSDNNKNNTNNGPPPRNKSNAGLPPTSTYSTPPSPGMPPTTNPYETDLSRLPQSDPFRDLPHYGRYAPHPTDFAPDPQHVMSTSPASIAYWEAVLREHCNEATLMLSPVDADPADPSSSAVALGRWIFAAGRCIVKTNHLAPPSRRRRDYSRVDANEVAALALVRAHLESVNSRVRVPRIYFAGKLFGGSDVLVQERLPGVSLEVAWAYLDREAKRAFVKQVRAFARGLAAGVVREDDGGKGGSRKRAYVVDDYGAIWARALTPRERKLMIPPPPPLSRAQTAPQGRAGIGWGKNGGAGADGWTGKGTTGSPRKPRADSGIDDDSTPRFFQQKKNNRSGSNVFLDDKPPAALGKHQRQLYKQEQAKYLLDRPDPDDTRFAHNDLSMSNIIVDAGRVVGVVDWEHAGWIGWRTAAAVHRELRAPVLPEPEEEDELDDEEWEDLWLWKGLYDSDSDGDGDGDDDDDDGGEELGRSVE